MNKQDQTSANQPYQFHSIQNSTVINSGVGGGSSKSARQKEKRKKGMEKSYGFLRKSQSLWLKAPLSLHHSLTDWVLQVTLDLLLSRATKSVALRRCCHQATWDEVETDPAGMSDSNAQELGLPPALWRPRQEDYMFEACLGSLMSHYQKGVGCGFKTEHLLRVLKALGLIPRAPSKSATKTIMLV